MARTTSIRRWEGSAIGLYDNRNRFYAPDWGRFLQPDPIGFNGDAANVYRYCGNNPANATDPNGNDPPDAGLSQFMTEVYAQGITQFYASNPAVGYNAAVQTYNTFAQNVNVTLQEMSTPGFRYSFGSISLTDGEHLEEAAIAGEIFDGLIPSIAAAAVGAYEIHDGLDDIQEAALGNGFDLTRFTLPELPLIDPATGNTMNDYNDYSLFIVPAESAYDIVPNAFIDGSRSGGGGDSPGRNKGFLVR